METIVNQTLTRGKGANQAPLDAFVRLLGRVLIIAMTVLIGNLDAQQVFPDKSRIVRMFVPFGAGSSSDTLARAYAHAISEVSGLNVVVENKPGANGTIGISSFLAAPNDGYSIILISASTLTLGPFLPAKLPYAPLVDLTPLVGVGKVDLILNMGPSTTFKSARDLISAARENPGKYTCASASPASQISCEMLAATAKIKLLVVPYKSTAAALMAVAGGEADILITDSSSASPQWGSGRVRPLAITSIGRSPAWPNLPALSDEGANGYEISNWFAIYHSSRTAPQISAVMSEILTRAKASKIVTEAVSKAAMSPLEGDGPEILKRTRDETDKWEKLIRSAGISLN